MALRYALLGLLARKPASGYELAKEFEDRLQEFAWNARHSQIYPELARLAKDGLVEAAEEGARGRRTYAITDAGRQDLRDWMINTPDHPYIRSETNLRLFLLGSLDRHDAAELLRRFHAYVGEQADELNALFAERDPVPPEAESWPDLMRVDFGRRMFMAEREWAADMLRQIGDAAASPSDAPTGNSRHHPPVTPDRTI